MDRIFATLDLLRAAPPPPLADSAAPARPGLALQSDLRSILACATMPSLVAPGIHLPHLRTIMLAILESQKKPIMRHNDVLHLRNMIALNLDDRAGLAHALKQEQQEQQEHQEQQQQQQQKQQQQQQRRRRQRQR
jgi:hypothetical protein